jgi:hypothetical protein
MAPLKAITNFTTQFTESNTAISKFVFIILMLLMFVFLFQVGVSFLQKWFGADTNPIVLDGMVASNKTRIISSNPNIDNSVPINRSTNEEQGLEYTWNVWFYVEELPNSTVNHRIFSKGNPPANTDILTNSVDSSVIVVSPGLFITSNTGASSVMGAPTETIDPTHANLLLVMNTFRPGSNPSEYAESITIRNIPIQKWVCCTIRVQNTTVDVYINGVMTQRKTLNNLPKQNYYDTYVGDSINGFNGYVSTLRYYSRAIGYEEIQYLYGKGPNRKMLDDAAASGTDYLSMRWYYNTPTPKA